MIYQLKIVIFHSYVNVYQRVKLLGRWWSQKHFLYAGGLSTNFHHHIMYPLALKHGKSHHKDSQSLQCQIIKMHCPLPSWPFQEYSRSYHPVGFCFKHRVYVAPIPETHRLSLIQKQCSPSFCSLTWPPGAFSQNVAPNHPDLDHFSIEPSGYFWEILHDERRHGTKDLLGLVGSLGLAQQRISHGDFTHEKHRENHHLFYR